MKVRPPLIIASVILLSFTSFSAFAQHQHSAAPAQANTSQTQAGPMLECQKHHTEGLAALEEATALLARAKQVTDPEQEKAAIDSAEKQIAEARHHLSMCPMAQAGSMDHSGMDGSQQQGHRMKCMSKESQPE